MVKTALLIDDNSDDRTLVARVLRQEFPELNLKVVTDETGFARAIQEGEFELVITDYQLGWTNGLDVVRRVKALYPTCLVVMFTGTGSEQVAVSVMKAGLDDYVIKSSHAYLLLPIAIRSLFERREANRKIEEAALACRDLMKELKSTETPLEDKIRVLDQIDDAVVHRELKIIELEKQVDRLRDELKRLKG